ncbi:MAG: branched-chain amino acid ABC transporter permease [Methanomicrobiales archaeon]|nr:branched-chain amino acid ABC transporter permease [Methanomicrobiales archaeon]
MNTTLGIASKKIRIYGVISLLILAFILPLILGMNLYILTILILMVIFIIYASSWNFLTYTGQGSLGHAAFFGLGGYASALVASASGVSPYITMLIGGGAAALVGLFIGAICVRLKEWFLAMVTFGFAIIIQTLMVSQFVDITGGWDGIAAPRLISSSVPNYLLIEYYSILVIAIIVIIIFWLILKSPVGLAFAAIRENEMEARAAGIDPVRYRLFAFLVSAYFSGVAGALEIHHLGYITPEIGPIVGTIVITVLWDGLQALGLTYARFIIIGLLLVLIIIFLPRGLISLPDRIRISLEKRRKTP